MRALIYDGPRAMHVANLAPPQPGPGQVLIKVRAAGICGSDVHGYSGASGRRVPGMVMGHEFAGTIAALGPSVETLQPGMRVAVNPLISCGTCPQCRAGDEQLCRHRRSIGVNLGQAGGFAEYVAAPASNVVPLADEISFAEGSMAEPLAVGLRAAAVAEPAAGQPLLVLGGGTIGLCTLLAARARGAEPVYVTDVAPHKLDMIARLGGVPFDTRTDNVAELARVLPEGGFRTVIDAVAITATLRSALPALVPGGTLVLVGLATPLVELGLYDLVPHERVIKSAYAYRAAEYRRAVELLNRREVDVRPLLEDRCSLEDAPAMFARLASGQNGAVKVVVEI